MKALTPFKNILRSTRFRRVFALTLSLFIITLTGYAQSSLTRISTSKRSDGKGYVIRFSMSNKADSFKVYQPTQDLIQFAVYNGDIDTTGIEYPEPSDFYDEISLHKIPQGLGIDVYLNKKIAVTADAYPDKNSKDLLLGLTYSSEKEIEKITKGVEPVIWSKFLLSDSAIVANNNNLADSDSDDRVLDDTYYEAKNKLKFDVVVIDAGHGGKDPGSIGYHGTEEKDVALAVALKLGHYINKYLPNVKVVYTRKDDKFVPLKERGSIANRAEGDLFVSIHCNSYKKKRAHGTEVYFLGLHRSQAAFNVMKKENSVIKLEDGNDKKTELTENQLLIYELANSGYMASSEKLAGMVSHQFRDRAKRDSRGVKQAGFIVLYHASMPAILTELGFITNPSEQRFLTSDYGQSIMASAIFRAVRNYKEQFEKSQHFTTTN